MNLFRKYKVALFALFLVGVILLPFTAQAVNYFTWSHGSSAATAGASYGANYVTGMGKATSVSIGLDEWVGQNLLVTGILTPGTFAPAASYLQAFTQTDVTLTSPTTTFNATGLYYITLTAASNVALTGCYPTGGVLGQEIRIKSGTGSGSTRFDDTATTLALGANITLTGSQDDFLTLQCTQAQGTNSRSRWAAVSAHDN